MMRPKAACDGRVGNRDAHHHAHAQQHHHWPVSRAHRTTLAYIAKFIESPSDINLMLKL